MYRIESLLSARLFIQPQIAGGRIYFISNLSGRLSLYVMDRGGSIPEPLLPPEIALQNPHLTAGRAFKVFPKLGKIMLSLDKDGDENYQPNFIPITGGYPTPVFGERFKDFQVAIGDCDTDRNLVYFTASSQKAPVVSTYLANLESDELTLLAESMYGKYPSAHNEKHTLVMLNEGYTVADNVLYLFDASSRATSLVYGVPIEQRSEGQIVPLNGLGNCNFVRGDTGIICYTTLFDDKGGLGFIDLAKPGEIVPVAITGLKHPGEGEFQGISHEDGDLYIAGYNIDGCDWIYEAHFDEEKLQLNLGKVLVGSGKLANGVIENIDYDKTSQHWSVSFSTATSPTQIFTIEPDGVVQHTRERLLGIPDGLLSSGEDASFTSFDGLRISARLYLPAAQLGYSGPRPLVYYIHGGPQSQERPDFAWFSIPLIQFLTMHGFAVFVPNVRGSTGYGLSYVKQVDRDWGGKDRLDHVHAMTEVLPKDSRLDIKRAGVVGRSYGGYMTLTLAFRHPELWSGAVDMFGPYDLLTFQDRIPETWKPYFYLALGHPEKDRDFLIERSPKTYMSQITCPMLVIQGKNDPRVVERESRDVIEQMRAMGKEVEYLMFENEGHDVLKFENRVTCYNAITDFFRKTLKP